MWHGVVVRHDDGFFRMTSRTLTDHLADSLNKLEEEHGKITVIEIIGHEEDKYAEVIVSTDG